VACGYGVLCSAGADSIDARNSVEASTPAPSYLMQSTEWKRSGDEPVVPATLSVFLSPYDPGQSQIEEKPTSVTRTLRSPTMWRSTAFESVAQITPAAPNTAATAMFSPQVFAKVTAASPPGGVGYNFDDDDVRSSSAHSEQATSHRVTRQETASDSDDDHVNVQAAVSRREVKTKATSEAFSSFADAFVIDMNQFNLPDSLAVVSYDAPPSDNEDDNVEAKDNRSSGTSHDSNPTPSPKLSASKQSPRIADSLISTMKAREVVLSSDSDKDAGEQEEDDEVRAEFVSTVDMIARTVAEFGAMHVGDWNGQHADSFDIDELDDDENPHVVASGSQVSSTESGDLTKTFVASTDSVLTWHATGVSP
jgi:hypothetical protein